MNYIKRIKRMKIIDIIFWLFLILFTYFIWNFNAIGKTAAYYEKTSLIQVLPNYSYPPCIYGTDDIQKIPEYKVTLENNTYKNEKYRLYLGIPNTFEHKDLKVLLKGKEMFLNNLIFFEKQNYKYYLLDTNELKANKIIYNFKIWNTNLTENIDNLDFNYYIEKI